MADVSCNPIYAGSPGVIGHKAGYNLDQSPQWGPPTSSVFLHIYSGGSAKPRTVKKSQPNVPPQSEKMSDAPF